MQFARKSHGITHADAKQVLRRAGYSMESIEEVLGDLPDPIDTERDLATLAERGVTGDSLIDRLGGSP